MTSERRLPKFNPQKKENDKQLLYVDTAKNDASAVQSLDEKPQGPTSDVSNKV